MIMENTPLQLKVIAVKPSNSNTRNVREKESALGLKNTYGFIASEDSYEENYSDTILQPTIKKKREKVSFPFTDETSTNDIEKFIKKTSPKGYEYLLKLKSGTPKERYEKYITHIKWVMNDFKGYSFYFIDSSLGNTDILDNLVTELYRNEDFYSKDNTDEKLNNVRKFLILQRDEGLLFSFFGHSLLAQSSRGLEVTKNMIKDLKRENIDIDYRHLDCLRGCAYRIQKTLMKRSTELNAEKGAISFIEYLQPDIAKEIIHYEKLKPGSSEFLGDIIENFLIDNPPLDLKDYLKTIRRYVDGLAIQGKTNIEDILYDLHNHAGEIKLTNSSVDKLLRLNFYSGISKPSRFVYFTEKNKQDTFDRNIDHVLKSFEDQNYKKASKVAVVILPGVIDDSDHEFDVFAARAGLLFKALTNEGCRILPFEVDKDKQILDSLIRAQSVAKSKPDILIICGHGSSDATHTEDAKATILGKTKKEISFKKINPAKLAELKRAYPEIVSNLEIREPLPLWKTEGAGNSKITFDEANLDKNDINLMRNIGLLMAKNGKVVFNSCSVGKSIQSNPSLAEIFAKESGLETFACSKNIQDTVLIFQGGNLVDVNYKMLFEIKPTCRFKPAK